MSWPLVDKFVGAGTMGIAGTEPPVAIIENDDIDDGGDDDDVESLIICRLLLTPPLPLLEARPTTFVFV